MSSSVQAPAPPTDGDVLEALPVVLELSRPDAARVTAWVEGVLGWQPVDPDGAGLRARLRLVDVPAVGARTVDDPASREPTDGRVPVVLLLAPDDAPSAVAAAVARWRPAATLVWPDQRDRLVDACREVLTRARPLARDGSCLRVGGAAGGVGTTTVALALGALAAWQHGATLVVTWGAVPMAVPRTVERENLGGQRTFDEASVAPGLPGLRVVRAAGPPLDATVDAGPARVVVRDQGIGDEVDVLVLRRDAAGIAALERSAAAVAVLLDDGPASPSAVAGAAGGRRVLVLPRSARVARAGLLGRVPGALPASYLRSLRPLVPAEGRRRGH